MSGVRSVATKPQNNLKEILLESPELLPVNVELASEASQKGFDINLN